MVVREKGGIQHTIKDHKEGLVHASLTEEIAFGRGLVRVETRLDQTTWKRLIDLLNQNEDMFAWEIKGLKSISRKLAEHKLKVTLGTHLACQRL